MATTFLFANNAATTLVTPISDSDTQATVADGSDFPTPGADEIFAVTFVDAPTRTVREICYCTNRTGNVLTITRGEEGTTPEDWPSGSTVANFLTAGQMEAMQQFGPGQETPQFWPAGGTADALTITPSPAYAQYFEGMVVRVMISANNTGAATLNVNGLGAQDILDQAGNALTADTLVAGRVMTFAYNGSDFLLAADQPISSFISSLSAKSPLLLTDEIAVDGGSGAQRGTLSQLAVLIQEAQAAEIAFWGMM